MHNLTFTATMKDASTKHMHTDTRTHTPTSVRLDIFIDGYLFKGAIREAMYVSYVDIDR